jgi:type VI secretion system Hcp family effector
MSIGEYSRPKGDARMLEMFWKGKGAKQGDLKNSCDMKGYETYSRVIAIQWGVSGEVDHQTGHRTGHRILDPLIITKRVDASSPLLLAAMIGNETIKESEFVYVDILGHQTQAAKTGRVLTITTTNGVITKVEGGSTEEGMMIERIYLYFDKITWRHDVGKTEAMDDRTDNVS